MEIFAVNLQKLCPVWNGRAVLHMLQHSWSDYQADNIVIVTMGSMQSPLLPHVPPATIIDTATFQAFSSLLASVQTYYYATT